MSIRLRLTLLYSAILVLTLITFGTVLSITVERATLGALTGRLKDEAHSLIAAQEFALDRIILPASKITPQAFVQTHDLDGSIVTQTPNLRDADVRLPLDDAELRQVLKNGELVQVRSIEGSRLLTYSTPVKLQGTGQVIGIVQVARPLTEQDQSLNTLKRLLIAGSTIVTFIAFGAGWLLSGIALRPIGRITETARAIGAERDFSRRVDYRGPHDEVGRLATTFNAMLAALQDAYQQVERTLAAQRRFVADASHELRTPLTTIRGNLGLLGREPPISAGDRPATLADLVSESERMGRLVNDLLALARVDAGRPLRSEPVSLAPLLDDACRQARLLAPDRPIDCDLPPTVDGLAVVGDPDALKQVLLILLDNAVKFSAPQGAIGVTAAPEGGRVAIAVRDSGPGIAPDVLPHIFERFYRGDTARTGGGAGLGLAIAKGLVEAQGGTLAVVTELGRGSTFTVTLPQAATPARLGGALATRAVG